MIENKIVVSYMRYSSHNQDESNSIEAQRFAIEKYCSSMGWKIAKEYIDAAYTGTNKNRPQYSQLMQDAKNKEFDILLVHKIDRLHRNTVNTLTDVEEFQALGIRCVAVGDGIDTEDVGVLGLTLKAAFAEEY